MSFKKDNNLYLLCKDIIGYDFGIKNKNDIINKLDNNKNYSFEINNNLYIRNNEKRLKTKEFYNEDINYLKSLKKFNRPNEINSIIIKIIINHFKDLIKSYYFNKYKNGKSYSLIIFNYLNNLDKLFNKIDIFITYGFISQFYNHLLLAIKLYKNIIIYLKEINMENTPDIIKIKNILIYYKNYYNNLIK